MTIFVARSRLARDDLQADEQRSQGGHCAEHAQGDGQGLDGAVDLGLHRGDGVEGKVGAWRRQPRPRSCSTAATALPSHDH